MSEYRLDATIPTVQFGNVHVQANNPDELLELIQHASFHRVLDELQLIDAEQNAKAGGLVTGGSADADRDAQFDTRPERGDEPREAQGGGSWQQSKARSNARSGGGQAPTCQHNKPMKFVTKTTGGRDGNGFKAWMCNGTRVKEDQCKPIFLDD